MRAKLFSRTGELAALDCEFSDEATIGRFPENTIVLPGRLVSNQHARVFFDAGSHDYALEDLQSKNGTHLDGLPVTARRALSDLHVITIAGAYDLVFQRLSEEREQVSIASPRSVGSAEPEASAFARSAAPASAPHGPTGDETMFDRGDLPAMPELGTPARSGGRPAAPVGSLTVVDRESVVDMPELRGRPGQAGSGDDAALATGNRRGADQDMAREVESVPPVPPAGPAAGGRLPVGNGTVLDRAGVLATPVLLSDDLPTDAVDAKGAGRPGAPRDVVAPEPASTRPAEESVPGTRGPTGPRRTMEAAVSRAFGAGAHRG